MAYLIYDKNNGAIDSLRTASGMDGAEIVENIFGVGAGAVFGSVPWFRPFPVGMKVDVDTLSVIPDPDYVPPADPVPVVPAAVV